MSDSSRPLTRLDPARLQLPEKPALEGLEAKWMPRWEASGIYRFDRTRPRAGRLLDRHAAAHRQRIAARRPRLLVHPHRSRRALPADARQGRVLPDGMGRQRPADRAPRAELLRRALRSVAAVRPAFEPPAKPPKQPMSVSRPNFIELCDRLTAEDEKAFEHLWKTLGLSVDWSMTYATIGKRAQRVSQLAFLHLLARGLAYQVEAPTLWDVDFRTAVAQAELEDREMPGAYHRIRFSSGPTAVHRDRDDAARADPGLRRARRASRRCAVPAAVRTGRGDAAVRRPRAGAGARARRSRKGQRHRDDLHLRRRHRRHLVARAEPAGARRHPAGRHAARRSPGARRAGSRPTRRARSASTTSSTGLSAAKARAKIVEQLRETGDLVGEPRPITHAVKFYEKGDRPLEIVTSRQWFIKTIEFRDALLARGRELQWHPDYMRGPLRELGQRPERRLVRQPPAVLRRAVSGVVSARRARAAALRRGRSPARRTGCRSIRPLTCRRATAPISAACRAASPAIPTSWTPGRPRR